MPALMRMPRTLISKAVAYIYSSVSTLDQLSYRGIVWNAFVHSIVERGQEEVFKACQLSQPLLTSAYCQQHVRSLKTIFRKQTQTHQRI